ncbi:Nickel uptake substrate-specific transmembrane region [Phaeobacter italicus]|uniref:Nickel uptake substrate-specific transmembrane region n=1 Tax=Phaeobacter italicus TaxID=481446 RepID=A0A0H5D3J0_9RHOB|nr:DUF4198 domain-containing protein [Phaeobacter italicus]CRL11303.1 Nickel uptake substrate-specific transmembrane region [Phaeobacter italicus]
MSILRPIVAAVAGVLTLPIAGAALSHEFWIAPEKYQVELGGSLQADLKNGQRFKGFRLPYLTQDIDRFDIRTPAGVVPYVGRLGDTPALQLDDPAPGLTVLLHETQPDSLTYDTWEEFAEFARDKGFANVEARHTARGLPRNGFSEIYTRHAKSLVAVGDGAGQDQPEGLLVEFVALKNPYIDNLDDGLPVRLYYQTAHRPDAQIEVFERTATGDVTITKLKTNADGIAVIPVSRGNSYLLDAVMLEPRDPASGTGAVWATHWAALTFAVPN